MLTRRDFMAGAIAAGVIIHTKNAFATPSQPSTPVDFDVPMGACDCHTHIHDPEKFPYFSGRVYTPDAALPDEMARLHKALHIQRVVIVTPSVYGTNNSATLYGMKARGASPGSEKRQARYVSFNRAPRGLCSLCDHENGRHG